MDRIRIVGGRTLEGNIQISGAKNAALPLMIAALLTDETLTLENTPSVADVGMLLEISEPSRRRLFRRRTPARRRAACRRALLHLSARRIVDITAPL